MKMLLYTDILITEGFIEAYFFAEFFCGRKAVLPDIATATIVTADHCSEFIANSHARTGILENNSIHKDMLYAAQAKLTFILNAVIDAKTFCKMVTEAQSPQKLLEEFARIPRNETKPDQWEAQILCRILSKHKVIMGYRRRLRDKFDKLCAVE